MPGWQFLPRDTNGNCEFIIGDYFDTAVYGEYTTAGFTRDCKARARFLLGTGGGLDLRGKLVLERTTIARGTATVALDFDSSQCIDIAPTATAVSFFTTNTSGTITGAGTRYEQRVFTTSKENHVLARGQKRSYAVKSTYVEARRSGSRVNLPPVRSGELRNKKRSDCAQEFHF